MPTIADLQPFITEPRENLSVEYKNWLQLDNNHGKATLAKAVIALANFGGGYVVVGFNDDAQELEPQQMPNGIVEFTQDSVNAAVRRYASPELHCTTYSVPHPDTGDLFPVVAVPGNVDVPVMSARDCEGVIIRNRCYLRKPGPRSEEINTPEEWRALFSRCTRANRTDLLDSIRSIISGQVIANDAEQNTRDQLQQFVGEAHDRWQQLIDELEPNSPSRFPHGYYEIGIKLVGAEPTNSLNTLQERLGTARQLRLTGWTPFLEMQTHGWEPYPYNDGIEAWVGRPVGENWADRDPHLCDFWRVSKDGQLFTIRGFAEDKIGEEQQPGGAIDVTLPVWRIAEAVLFASRLAEQFDGSQGIAITCKFTGLMNRVLTSLSGRRALFDDRSCRTNEIGLFGEASLVQINDNLVEFIHQLLVPLYERFAFFELSNQLVDEEIIRMTERRM